MKTSVWLVLMLAMTLGACGGSSSDQDIESEEVEEETVFDPMVDTIDRAHAVEDLAAQRRDDIDKAIEEAEGDDDQ